MEKREENIQVQGHAPTDNIAGNEFPFNAGSTYTRYSDEDLKEFKEIVNSKLAEARYDYELLRGTLSGTHENGTDDTSPSYKLVEDAADGFSKEEIARLAVRQQKFIENLQNALVRIENKTYGICRISGKLISKERLRSVPHTTLCIDAKLEMSRIN
jgi:DnaK suppressor protein